MHESDDTERARPSPADLPALPGWRPAKLPDGGWGACNDAAAVLPSALTGRRIVVTDRLRRSWTTTVREIIERTPEYCSGPRQPSLSPTATARTASGCFVKPGRSFVQSLRRSADAPPDLTWKSPAGHHRHRRGRQRRRAEHSVAARLAYPLAGMRHGARLPAANDDSRSKWVTIATGS